MDKETVGCTGRDKNKENIKINERIRRRLGAPEEIKIKKIKINEWVNRWLSAPEEMEVERREEVEEEGGELVQAVEHLK